MDVFRASNDRDCVGFRDMSFDGSEVERRV